MPHNPLRKWLPWYMPTGVLSNSKCDCPGSPPGILRAGIPLGQAFCCPPNGTGRRATERSGYKAATPSPSENHERPRFHRGSVLFVSAVAAICLLAAVVVGRIYLSSTPDSTIQRFWAPAHASNRILLICLAKPVLYRPSAKLHERTARYPGEFSHMVDRMDSPPNLKPNDLIHGGDMERYYEFGVAEGGLVLPRIVEQSAPCASAKEPEIAAAVFPGNRARSRARSVTRGRNPLQAPVACRVGVGTAAHPSPLVIRRIQHPKVIEKPAQRRAGARASKKPKVAARIFQCTGARS